jgi:hypothetical protein
MRSIFILLFLVLGTTVHAGTPTGKNQSLNSPDQVPEGLAKSDWHSIRAAYEAGRHAFHAVDGGWQARNPGQQWTTKFDGRGFLATPRDGGWTWGLELTSYGFGDRQKSIHGKPEVQTEGQRLSYRWNPELEEWFGNDQRGLEHGFIVHRRPESGAELPSATLDFLIANRGKLRPSVTSDAKGLTFHDEQGNNVLNYTGLKVWDADGKTLASCFEAAGEKHVLLRVKEQGARYPITIDPIAQQAYLKASNNSAPSDDRFGTSVAVSGDTVVVGAYGEGSNTTGVNSTPSDNAPDSGAVYVFVRSGTVWNQQAYLKASNTGAGDYFGSSVSVSGDTVVVGALNEDSSTTGVNSTPNESAASSGAAYVFVRSGTVWSQQAYLKASNTGSGDNFGRSVSVSGDTVVVGAYGEDSSTTGINSTSDESAINSGAAYVFVRSAGVWGQQSYLKASNTGASDNFGWSVAVSGNTVAVGAPYEDSSTTGVNSTPNESAASSGAAYVFVRSGTVWNQQAYLKTLNTGANDNFGYSVAVDVDTVVVGASEEDSSTTGVNSTPNESAGSSGAAYVFVYSAGVWSQRAYLKASNTGPGDRFGFSVAVSGGTVVVGAYGEGSSTTGVNSTPIENASGYSSGAAYVFVRNGTTWSQQAYLKASNTGASDSFGSVAVSSDTVVVGASGEDSSTTGVNSTPNENAPNAGAAYVFVRSTGVWNQQAYLKASNTPTQGSGEDDRFGRSVAVSGDTVVVGAPQENSSTTGVNSTPNESAGYSGAVYVFVRSGTAWSQQAYLKASNTGVNDLFGTAVAVSGDTVVVGAPQENSSTTGVNSTPNESAGYSGAVYVFVRSGTAWSQQAYLKASNTGVNDLFGTSVAVSGDTLVIGAPDEDSSTTGVNSTPNNSATDSGAAYVFVRSGTLWSQQAYLKPSNTGAGDDFGYSVAMSGNTLVVGAYGEDSSTTGINSTSNESALGSGAAYVFVRSGTVWSQQAYLKAFNTGAGDGLGFSVAVSGDTVIAGAVWEDSSTMGVDSTPNNSATDSGAAYVFMRSGTVWSQQAYLKPSNTGAGDDFGGSVAVSGDTVVVGAYGEDSSTTGVNSTPNESASSSGAAYVFVRSGTVWSQQAYLKASNTGENDRFGVSVAVSGDTAVVGAHSEDSGTTGVNSTPNDSTPNAGAAYILGGLGPIDNANLSALTLSSGTLSPVFASGTTSYSASVGNATSSITVTPTKADANATVTVNGASPSTPVALNVGANVISLLVTAQDGTTTKTYTVTITRAAVLPSVNSPTSSAITATSATLGGNVTFDGGGTISERGVVYAVTATNGNPLIGGTGVTKLPVTGTTGVFSANATGLTGGTSYSFKAYVTNSAGTSYTTVATFTTLSANANLSNLVVSGAPLSPAFASGTTSYTSQVPNTTTSVTVTPTAANSFATIQVNGVAVPSGTASGPISLNVGSNVISTVVTAQNGTTRTYTVTVTRAAALPTVTSPTSAGITTNSATLGGNVSADGGGAISERGVVYAVTATNNNPLIGGTGVTKVAGTGTTGVFTVAASGLAGGTAYSFKAYATNSAGTSYSTVAAFSTLVPNSAPTDVTLSATSFAENNASGATIATLAAVDPDAGNTHTFELVSGTGSTDNAHFTITGNTLTISVAADFETKASYALRLRATDQGGLFVEKAFTLSVTDQNEAPTDVSLSATSFAENNASGATIATLAAVDPDAGNTHTFELVAGDGSTDNAHFTITGNALNLSVAADFETKASYDLRLRATDQGGLFVEKAITLSVTDQNEAPTDLTLSTTDFAENNAPGAAIATLAAVDPDAGNTHSFALVESDGSRDNNLFSVEGNALKISVAADFEDIADYVLRLRATDQNGLFFEKVVTLFVTNVNEGSTDATLVGLLLSEGVVAFRSDVTAYESVVAATTDSILVTPHAAVRSATVTVNNHSPVVPVPLVVGPNTITIRVTSEDGGTTQTYSLVVIRQTTFAAWAASHGATDPLADADGDGLNTLLEYAFGLNPQAPGTSSNLPRSETITVGENKTVLRIVFTRPKVAGGVSYDVEFSNDPGMNTRSTAGAYLTVDNGDGTETVVVHDIPPPDSSFPARFGRVRIVKAE